MSFRVEYKRGSTAPAMFQRQVRFQVDISAISKQPNEPLFAITFTLLSGEYSLHFFDLYSYERAYRFSGCDYNGKCALGEQCLVSLFVESTEAQTGSFYDRGIIVFY